MLYAIYVRAHFVAESEAGHGGDLAPLRFHRLDRGAHRADPVIPRLRVVNLQVIFALGLIIVGAIVFVDAVTKISAGLGISATLLALVIAPIATELPEKLNSVIWVRQGKDTLAIGNISGAMVFQSLLPGRRGPALRARQLVDQPRVDHRLRLGRDRHRLDRGHLPAHGPSLAC